MFRTPFFLRNFSLRSYKHISPTSTTQFKMCPTNHFNGVKPPTTNMGGATGLPRPAGSAYPQLAPKPVGKKITPLYKDRIAQLYSAGQYEGQNLRGMLYFGEASGEPHVKLLSWSAPDLTRPTFKEVMKHAHDFKPTSIGSVFGPSWSTHWFRVEVTIPEALCDQEFLEFHWDANNEGLIWSEDGKPLQGLTGGGERVEWIIPDSFRNGNKHVFYVEMACNGMFGCAPGGDSIQPPDPNKTFQLAEARVVAVNKAARQLWIDAWIVGDAAREFPETSMEQHQALVLVNKAMDAFESGSQESILEARKILEEYLGKNVDSSKVYGSDKEHVVTAIGHCHIDSCWLWPWAETKRKVARSWSNQCNLMERYPEHTFACSQAQQYKWLEQDYPYVFDRVKAKVKSGQFHPIGGSWVEHDTNMPSGESLVRQFLYGQRYFERHFGERCQTFWLPDTFGYSAQLPQLCRLAGMTRFLTQKLSWNNINNFPHTTFNWVALDGSQVICHMPPSETYTAEANFGDVVRSVSRHKSMDQDHTSMLVFGKGDGGGGPTWQHLEKLRRCRAISDQVGLLPRVHMGPSVDEFFDKIQAKADTLVTWYGELYFELHRGTYTTQAKNKSGNRKSEFLMRDVELLATMASLKDKSYKYPKGLIDKMWEGILLCQFHDCLPGSSIEMCYDDSDEVYAMVFETGKKLMKEALKALGSTSADSATVGQACALNTLSWPRKEIIEVFTTEAAVACGSSGPLMTLRPVKAVSGTKKAVSVQQVSSDVFVLENDHLRIKIEKGVISSLYDIQADRETIRPGEKANQFVIFDDKPLYWQAWDVEVYHLDSRKELSCSGTSITEDKPHRVSVTTTARISDKSSLKSTITLSASLKGQQSYVEVNTEVDWHETMKFLKVEFPVDVMSTEASYETQFGIVKRPTHYNTSWDMAKFEVCCHKFADLSEANYGVSILNDGKYGFATAGNMMRLSLLRAPKAPDAHADMGHHSVRWAILPHAGAVGMTTVRKGYEFNSPIKVINMPSSAGASSFSLPVTVSGDENMIIDTIKRGEDDDDVATKECIHLASGASSGRSVIVRVYEALGGRARGVLESGLKVKKVTKTNLLEDDLEELEQLADDDDVEMNGGGNAPKKGNWPIELRPFEVATYRFLLE